MRTPTWLLALALLAVTVPGGAPSSASAAGARATLTARPHRFAFGDKRVGATYYKRTRIQIRGSRAVRVLVRAGLPDDFGFGLLPGSTCPVLGDGAVMQPGDSCFAVVRFTPSAGFVGWSATGEVLADASDPATGALVQRLSIPVTGRAILP